MSLSENAGEVAREVCGLVSKEFGDWCKAVTEKIIDFPCKPEINFDRHGMVKEVKVTCEINSDVITEGIEKVIEWFKNKVTTVHGNQITREMIEGIYKDKGIDVSTRNLRVKLTEQVIDTESRFRAINDYAARNGYAAGFPNFHQANYGDGVVFGTILLKNEFVEKRDVTAAELGNPPDFSSRYRAVNDYAIMNGFATGFPNFHQADYGNGLVYGVILLKHEALEWKDVLVTELNNPPDIPSRFRAVNDYARINGFATGFPNFHQANHGNGIVYGIYLLKNNAVEIRAVNIATLFPPQIDIDVIDRPIVIPPAVPWSHNTIKPW
ncbi:MAG: hypothetical protein CVU84_05005 [Firmicutes bacterium HGW-Firmicutes-1]|jgi:hypothetical protein|nr:MAG: hypothetical protein CVU84_05005 [Firmicutes bacterium HGW-Firmicutes-1]